MLILVRHGESETNAAGRLVGRSDPPLTPLGRRQAELTARFLAAEVAESAEQDGGRRAGACAAVPIVVSSPLSRTLATAEVIVASLWRQVGFVAGIVVDERLVELDYGSFDDRRMADIDRTDLDRWRQDPTWRPPGGETLAELQARVGGWCDSTAERASIGDVIAVSHVSPIKAAVAWAIGGGPELAWKMTLRVAAVTRIATSPRSLVSFGETGHLRDAGP